MPGDLKDLSGRVAVVTGGNTGLGLETVVALARAGAHVELASRTRSRGEAAADEVRGRVSGADVAVLDLDLADLDSVRSTAADLRARFDAIHVLVNNAGVMMTPERTTADGFELQMGVNHLGHFALTGLLLEPLLAARDDAGEDARVVAVSSIAHLSGKLRPLEGRPYDRTAIYQQSKLANLVFSLELDRRARAAGAPLTSAAAHPGLSSTELGRNMAEDTNPIVGAAMKVVMPVFMKVVAQDAEQGARPQVHAAAGEGVEGGSYWGPKGFREFRGSEVGRARIAGRARNEADAKALWDWSVEKTGVAYTELGNTNRKT